MISPQGVRSANNSGSYMKKSGSTHKHMPDPSIMQPLHVALRQSYEGNGQYESGVRVGGSIDMRSVQSVS